MPTIRSVGEQHCPECGQQLQTLWDYPSNEVWCLRCGNRFYRVLSQRAGSDAEAHCRMLLLDGNGTRREALTGRFATIGFQVTPVCHPRQAMEAASFRHFDLALLSADWSGFETSGLIDKLRWQLGNVKFVVYLDSEVENLPGDLPAPDVVCLRTSLERYDDLESTLEQLIHGLIHGVDSAAALRTRELAPVS